MGEKGIAAGLVRRRGRPDERLGPQSAVARPTAIRLQLRGILEHRDLALRAVATACRMVTRSPRGRAWKEFQHQVLSAVSEGFNNVVLHGKVDRAERAAMGGGVDLRIETRLGRIRIELRDWGPGFDPSRFRRPAIDPLPESGMGLHIMRSFMDMSYRAGRPNVLKLDKRFAAAAGPARAGGAVAGPARAGGAVAGPARAGGAVGGPARAGGAVAGPARPGKAGTHAPSPR
jgi:serine/threonine-protein kinase RsbW